MNASHGDRLRRLFKAYSSGDSRAFRDAAETIVQDERLKNHRLLADDLERILLNGHQRPSPLAPIADPRIPKDRERGLPLVDVNTYQLEWARLVVPAKTEAVLRRIADEHHRGDVLQSSGLSPTRTVLFFGPPGCGKTLAARVLSSVLSRPLIVARFDAVVSSFLGETAANLRKVFEYVAATDGILLVDELDALAKDRDNQFEHGELKRVVNTLLQLIDQHASSNLIIGATNHERLLDSAVWRRFEEVVQFPRPLLADRTLMLRQFFRGFETDSLRLSSLASELSSATGADLEQLALHAARTAVLDGRHEISTDDLRSARAALVLRFEASKPAGRSSNRPKRSVRR